MQIEHAKILLVEDDPVMRMFVVSLLNRLGVAQVQEAADGKSGLARVETFLPDLILSDIHMASMNGLEFVRNLRMHRVTSLRNTPVIIMSADSSTEMLNDSAPLGISSYIIKPPSLVVMQSKLGHALKYRH